MEEPISAKSLPKTDSIDELAKFWDSHDVTDFEDQLEEVADPVFERGGRFTVELDGEKADTVRRLAQAEGLPATRLIQVWVDELIDAHRADQTT